MKTDTGLRAASDLAEHYRVGLFVLPARWLDGLPALEHVGQWLRPLGSPVEIWQDSDQVD